MPYIKQGGRKSYDRAMENLEILLDGGAASEGDLNYVITRCVTAWLRGRAKNYAQLNAALGILEAAKLEFYRRVVAPYEDQKRKDNGDVY
jgi:uncharacterized protein DUF6899